MIEDYVKNGLSMNDIIKKYHISFYTLQKLLDNNGIQHTKKKPNRKNMRVLTKEEEETICQIYKETGQASKCCEAISSGQDVVRRCLQKYGLYRSQHEAIIQSPQNQRKYPVKDEYFDTENDRMAYVLGFLAADGTVRKNTNEIKIGLSSTDKEFLEILSNELGGRPISTYTTSEGFECSTLEFTSKHIKEKIAEYNIVPNKTFTFTFPKNLNRKYWIDFIRGYFDGDGSVSAAGKAIRFQICAANREVLETIVDFLYDEYNIPKVNIQKYEKNRVNPIYNIQYSTNSTKSIYKILYHDDCLFLPRKKKKYEELLNII